MGRLAQTLGLILNANMRQLSIFLLLFQTAIAQAESRPLSDTLVLGAAQGLILGVLGVAYFTWKRYHSRRLSKKIAETLPDIAVRAAEGDLQTVAALLDAGADPNAAGPSGQTALMLAARNGHFDTIRLLLERGANSALRTKTGSTAEDIAKTYKQPECASLLAQHQHGS